MRNHPFKNPGFKLGSGEATAPAKRSASFIGSDDDAYKPDVHERSPSPEGPEAQEVADELAALAEEEAEILDECGRSLGFARVGGEVAPERPEDKDKALEAIKKDDRFQENSKRLASRMNLTWLRGLSDEAKADEREIDAGQLANDKVPAKHRKLEPCNNGAYVKVGGKYRQISASELEKLGQAVPCRCGTCAKQRSFAGYYKDKEAEWKKTRSEKNYNSVGQSLGD